MMSFLSTELGKLINHMDMMSSVVLFFLLFMSIGCWTIFFYKVIQLRKRGKENRELLHKLGSFESLERLKINPYTVPGYGASYIVSSMMNYIEVYQSRKATQYLSLQEWEGLQFIADQLVEDVVHEMESGLSFLSTSAAVSPLLGLFGTVWGLVHAFIAIGKMHSTDISSVAPGIAQALITTLAGLMVAIPAVIMYNYLTTKIRSFEQELYSLCNKCGLLVQHSLVR